MKRKEGEREEGPEVDHQDVLDRILDKLYDFGPAHTRLKKKDHKQEVEEEVNAETTDDRACGSGDAYAGHMTDGTIAAPGVEIIRFQDPLKKNRSKRTLEPEPRTDEGKEKKKKGADVLSMEKARLDVHRFGITGFQKQQQRVFEQDRAIMLGARPPKKEYVNYKVYQKTLKEKKSKEIEEESKSDNPKKKKRSSGKQKNVKRKSGGAEPGGHVGRYKDGMLLLSTKDIQKVNSKKRK